MDATLIDLIAKRGRAAATELVKRFVAAADVGSAAGWDEQRWVRLNVFVRMLEKRLPAVETASKPGVAHARDFTAMIEEAKNEPPAGRNEPLTEVEAEALNERIRCLIKFADEFGGQQEKYSFEAIPEPELRVRPPL